MIQKLKGKVGAVDVNLEFFHIRLVQTLPVSLTDFFRVVLHSEAFSTQSFPLFLLYVGELL